MALYRLNESFLFKTLWFYFCYNGLVFSFANAQDLHPEKPSYGFVSGPGTITLSWNKLNNVLSNYSIELYTDSNLTSLFQTYTSNNLSYTLSGLTNCQTYYWRVIATNPSGPVTGNTGKFTIFNPSCIDSLQLWLRADTGLSITGGKITSWADLSTNNFQASQSTVSAQAVPQTGGFNGFPSVYFDGNDKYSIPSFPYDLENTGFVVGQRIGTTGNAPVYIGGPAYSFDIGSTRCFMQSGTFIGAYSTFSPSLISFRRISGNSTCFLNGVQNGTASSVSLNPITPGTFLIGNRADNLTPLNGHIAEIVVYNDGLDDSQRMMTENYLMNQYTSVPYLGPDTMLVSTFCPVTLSVGPEFSDYIWSNGDTTSSIIVYESGFYWIEASDVFGRRLRDTIQIQFPQFNQISNQSLCTGSQLNWNSGLSAPFLFTWSDGTQNPAISIQQAGTYYVSISDTNGCIFHSDTVIITEDNFSQTATLGSDTALCQGNALFLQQGSAMAGQYLWSDGSTNDSLEITSAGTYSLQVLSTNGCLAFDTIQISLAGIAPNALFSSENVCEGLPINFTDLSTPPPGETIVGYEWNFGDGNTSVNQNPSHLYNQYGVYSASLKVISSSGCGGIYNDTAIVFRKAKANFIPLNNCTNSQTVFLNLSSYYGGTPLVSFWDFGLSGNTDTLSSDTGFFVYQSSGNFSVSQIISTAEGCADTLISQIQIKPSPQANFSFSGQCIGDTTILQDLSQNVFPWYTINRLWVTSGGDSSTYYSPSFYFANAGNHDVTLYISSSNGCKDTIHRPVVIYNNPIADFNITAPCINQNSLLINTSSCIGCQIEQVSWTANSLQIGFSDTIPITFDSTGLYDIILTVSNQAACQSTISDTIEIKEPPQSFFGPEIYTIPPGVPINFENNSNISLNYYWSFGDQNYSFLFEPSHAFADTGEYTVELLVTDSLGCTGKNSRKIICLDERNDIQAIQLNSTYQNDLLVSELLVINSGNYKADSLIFNLKADQYSKITEYWNGLLYPGQMLLYKFKSSVNINDFAIPYYSCANVASTRKETDLSNNEACTSINGSSFWCSSAFPDPASESVNLFVYVNEQTDCNIQITDASGKIVSEQNLELSKGINKCNFSLLNLTQGLYFCRLNVLGQETVKKFYRL